MSEMMQIVAEALSGAIADCSVQVDAADEAGVRIDHIKMLRSRMTDLEKKEESLWEKYAEEGMPRKVLDSLLAKNDAQKKEVAALIAAAEAEPQPIDYQERLVTFSGTLEAMRNPDAPASETNELLKSCIRRITYSRSRGNRIHGAKGGWAVNPIRAEIELIL